MAIIIKTPQELNRFFATLKDKAQKGLEDGLSYVGEKYIKQARELTGEESYIDQTGNLRSSTGCVVSNNGAISHIGSFEAVLPTATEGTQTGTKSAENAVAQHPNGTWMFLVAGMDYASYVEAMENKNVLALTINKMKQNLSDITELIADRIVTECEKL